MLVRQTEQGLEVEARKGMCMILIDGGLQYSPVQYRVCALGNTDGEK